MDDQWSFRICVQTQAPLKNFGETAKLVFLMKVQNSVMESLARIIFNALCWYKYGKTNKMFYFGQIIPGTEML